MICLPNSSTYVLQPVPALNFFNAQTVEMRREISPLDVWNAIMASPQPLLKIAFKIRDPISSLFGVKRIGGFSGQPINRVNVGEYLDFFLVEHVDDHCLVLTERDRHLDVMTCISTQGIRVTVTSSVCVHNLFGRAYMIPVGIAHPWIVRGMLKRVAAHRI